MIIKLIYFHVCYLQVQAFVFDIDSDSGNQDIKDVLLSALFSAFITNILLFPVAYFLPYMISQVNSFSTGTKVPQKMVEKRWNAFKTQCVDSFLRKIGKQKNRATVLITQNKEKEDVTELYTLNILKWWWDSIISSEPKRNDIMKLAEKNLFFLCYKMKLPKLGELRGWYAQNHHNAQFSMDNEMSEPPDAKLVTVVHHNTVATQAIKKLQRKVRFNFLQREIVRLQEFDHWHHDCRPNRRILRIINLIFLFCVIFITLIVCILLSAAFSDEVCWKCLYAVLRSIAIQVRFPKCLPPMLGKIMMMTLLFLR